jgi:hypothetical protein
VSAAAFPGLAVAALGAPAVRAQPPLRAAPEPQGQPHLPPAVAEAGQAGRLVSAERGLYQPNQDILTQARVAAAAMAAAALESSAPPVDLVALVAWRRTVPPEVPARQPLQMVARAPTGQAGAEDSAPIVSHLAPEGPASNGIQRTAPAAEAAAAPRHRPSAGPLGRPGASMVVAVGAADILMLHQDLVEMAPKG